jgi:hypothetical protein
MIARGLGLVAATTHFGTSLPMGELLSIASQYSAFILGQINTADLMGEDSEDVSLHHLEVQ